MKPAEFSTMLCEWRARCAWSDAEAAAALGCAYGTLRHWLTARTAPGYFAMCAVVRQMREGHDPLTDARMTSAEFARVLKEWRVQHRFSQRQAAVAIGTTTDVVRGWESKDGAPRQPALGEILRRLRMPVDEDLVKQATKRPRPIEPEKFAGLMWAWRRRCKLNRVGAAYALRSTGLRTTARTIWTWESARALPQRPLAVLELIHGPLAVNPPKPKPVIAPKQFATMLRNWRRAHCLTQAQACVALGLPRDQGLICRYERGEASPRRARMTRMLAIIAGTEVQP
jgi:transcriptional regulator with XRE-family HTH domain